MDDHSTPSALDEEAAWRAGHPERIDSCLSPPVTWWAAWVASGRPGR
jgi:hypothetical protein